MTTRPWEVSGQPEKRTGAPSTLRHPGRCESFYNRQRCHLSLGNVPRALFAENSANSHGWLEKRVCTISSTPQVLCYLCEI